MIKSRVVGVDVSLEETTYAIVDIRGNIIARDAFRTADYTDVTAFVTELCDRIITIVDDNGGYESIRSVGIGAPSSNYQTGCMVNSPNLPWKGVIPLASMLRDQLGIAVALANNTQTIALGEHAFGAAHGMKNFAVLSLGSGVGSCFFSNGRVYYGSEGFAGEIGHTCVHRLGRQCQCGKQGCLEGYASASGIIRTAKEVMEQSDAPSLMRSVENLTPKMITEFCDQGDELAQEVYRRTGFLLGLSLANYAAVLNPEAIIFTGGIARSGKWLMDPARESFDKHVFLNIKDKVQFLPSALDDRERDVLGASVLAWDVKEYSLFK